MEYQTENNIKKTEMITIVNEYAYEKENLEVNHVTEIKTENSSFNSTYINSENNHIEFESVVIKMEREDQYFEENVEGCFNRPLINKDEITSVISQNDIHLTASAIMEENINHDYEEHFCEKINNILKARESVNDNMQIKAEENYSLYSEKCANDPLVNQDEIKIDIVDNDIESGNGERNTEYKIENIEVSKEHVIPLEYEDKTDKEMKFFHKILKVKQKKNSLSKNITQKKCDVDNRKTKIVKKHECSICKKKFTQPSDLNRHMRFHTGEKLYECDVCQKQFTVSASLMYHKRIHSGEKPYECDVCQKKFNHTSDLRKHMRIHTGEKPYVCDICQKKFNQSNNLRKHMRIHTGEKPHECDVCQKKFSHLHNLKKHIRVHTADEVV